MSQERYSRQILFAPIGEEGQAKLKEKSIVIIGVGALGTVLANHFVRAGVQKVTIVDRDYVEMSNLQRQMLYDEDDVKAALPKAIAAERKLRKINSQVEVTGIVSDVTQKNIELLLEGVDLVVDGTDNFQIRFLMNDAAFKLGIPYLYGGAVGSRGMAALFIPNETPCLRCFIKEGQSSGETCDTVGVISPVVDLVASYQAVEGLKYLVGATDALHNQLLTFDVWHNHRYNMPFKQAEQDCPTCQQKRYPSLHAAEKETMTSLCGRETVQIHLQDSFDLKEWAKRLEKVADVQETPFLLRATLHNQMKIVLFRDGRTLIQGTEDIAEAKAIYSQYIGM